MTLPWPDLTHTLWMPCVGFALGRGLQWVVTHAPAHVLQTDPDAITDTRGPVRFMPLALAHAALWWLCAAHWDVPSTALAWAVFCGFLLALAWIDGRTTLLPDVLTQPLLWCGLLASLFGVIETPLPDAVLGAVIGYVSLWTVAGVFQRLAGKEGMGGGDFKLFAALGAWLGPLALAPLLLLASASGACVGWLWLKRQRLPAQDDSHSTYVPFAYVPFGPFLAGAGWIMAFAGDTVMSWLLGA